MGQSLAKLSLAATVATLYQHLSFRLADEVRFAQLPNRPMQDCRLATHYKWSALRDCLARRDSNQASAKGVDAVPGSYDLLAMWHRRSPSSPMCMFLCRPMCGTAVGRHTNCCKTKGIQFQSRKLSLPIASQELLHTLGCNVIAHGAQNPLTEVALACCCRWVAQQA